MQDYEQSLDLDFRKREGIFYSPNRITRFMVEEIFADFTEFERLPDLKILDPSCGTGAFLLEIFDFVLLLYQKHLPNFPNPQNWIVENNLYGVDLDENAVHICQKRLFEKSGVLSQNIKIGNSLISDKTVDHRAFDWQKEFSQAFSPSPLGRDGVGFDLVVGNPPYGAYLSPKHTEYLKKNYQSAEYQLNSYVLFYERGFELLKPNGHLGFITPNTFTYQNYFKKIRAIFSQYSVMCVLKHQYQVFPDANIGDTVSWLMKKAPQSEYLKVKVLKVKNTDEKIAMDWVKYMDFVKEDGTYHFETHTKIAYNLSYCEDLGSLVETIIMGVKAYQEGKGKPKQDRQIVDNKPFTSNYAKDQTFISCVNGKDFHRYCFLQKPQMFLSYGEWLAEPRFHAPFFETEKIIIRQTSDSLIAHLDTNKHLNLNNVYNIAKPIANISLKYILAILNSSFMNYLYQNISQEKGKLFAEVKKVYLEKLPIKVISVEKQRLFIEKVNQILQTDPQTEEFTNLKNDLDNMVFELYEVSETDKEVIKKGQR